MATELGPFCSSDKTSDLRAISSSSMPDQSTDARKNEPSAVDSSNAQPPAVVTKMSRLHVAQLAAQNISVPPDFICPLSHCVMQEPVLIASGFTYEREEVDAWFRAGNKCCPVTKEELEHLQKFPNRSLRSTINAWLLANNLLPAQTSREQQAENFRSVSSREVIIQAEGFSDSENMNHYRQEGDGAQQQSGAELGRGGSGKNIVRSGSDSSVPPVCPIWPTATAAKSTPPPPLEVSDSPSVNPIGGQSNWNQIQGTRYVWSLPQPRRIHQDLPDRTSPQNFLSPTPSHQPGPGPLWGSDSPSSYSLSSRPSFGFPSPGGGGGRGGGGGGGGAGVSWNSHSSSYSGSFGFFPPGIMSGAISGKLPPPASPQRNDSTGNLNVNLIIAALKDFGKDVSKEGEGLVERQVEPTAEEGRQMGRVVELVNEMLALERERKAGMEEGAERGRGEEGPLSEVVHELRGLVKDSPENREVLLRTGGVAPLIRFLGAENEALVEHAVTTLLNVSLTLSTHTQLLKEGAVEGIIGVLTLWKGSNAEKISETSRQQARENAAAAIFALTTSSDVTKAAVGEVPGGIAALVDLLVEESTSMRGKKDAALALFNLSLVERNRRRILESGGLTALVGMLKQYGSGLEEKAMAVLVNLAKVAEGRRGIREVGGIPSMVEMLEIGSGRGKEDAVAALLMLAEDAEVRDEILEEGIMPTLVALTQSGTPRARAKASKLLGILRSKPESQGTASSSTPSSLASNSRSSKNFTRSNSIQGHSRWSMTEPPSSTSHSNSSESHPFLQRGAARKK